MFASRVHFLFEYRVNLSKNIDRKQAVFFSLILKMMDIFAGFGYDEDFFP